MDKNELINTIGWRWLHLCDCGLMNNTSQTKHSVNCNVCKLVDYIFDNFEPRNYVLSKETRLARGIS